MRVAINLASRPFADIGPALQRLRIGMAVLAVVAIALGFGLHALQHKADAARAREHSLDGSIAHVNQERQGYQAMMREPQNAAVLDQSEALNKLIDAKAFSWTLAAEDLETVLPGGVQVTTLEPMVDKKTGQITVHLRVMGPRNKAVDLVQNLEHSKRFLEPRIIGESAESTNTPGAAMEPVSASNRVTFEVLADYNPATPAERRAANRKAEARESAETQNTAHPPQAFHTGPGLRRSPYTGDAKSVHRQTPTKPSAGAPR
jgi:type IV pilus assembly protein PilN